MTKRKLTLTPIVAIHPNGHAETAYLTDWLVFPFFNALRRPIKLPPRTLCLTFPSEVYFMTTPGYEEALAGTEGFCVI